MAWFSRSLAPLFATVVCLSPLGIDGVAAGPRIQVSPTEAELGYTFVLEVITEDPPLGDPSVLLRDPVGETQGPYPLLNRGGAWRALMPTSPLDDPGIHTAEVQGWLSMAAASFTLQPRSFPTQRITLPAGSTVWASEKEWNEVNAFRDQVTSEKYWQGMFMRPAQGPVTSIYGLRRYYNGVFAEDYYHRGIDYAGATGSPVMAPAAGRVGLVGYEADGYQVQGNTIGIDHGQGVTSVLLHLSRIDVQVGDWVEPGQVVGGVGATGASTGPHLHWGLFVHNVAVDPVPWLHLAMP